MAQQTAIQELINKLNKMSPIAGDSVASKWYHEGLQWAVVYATGFLEMEKEQIIVSFYEGMKTNTFDPNIGRGVIYYNETYGK